MPPRARRSTSRPSTQMYIDPAAFGALSIADLRSLCVRNGIQSTGVRKTLERRLRELNSPPPTRQNISEHESTALNIDATAAQRQERPEFTDDQMQTIQQLIADTVKQSAREIATEAARAAVNASSSLLAQRPASLVPDTAPETAVHPSTTPVSFASPFQEIPGQYIKDIQSGEFFDLSKLLPKNLSLYDEDDNVLLSLENSVVKVSKKSKPTASTSITDIEQWTTAFTSYMSVLIDKFPTRSQELLQYISLIRYAARVHKGLGWAIYDFKFRQKASVNKSLNWSVVDTQLWLTIFTVSPAVLKEEYPLFSNGPQRSVSGGANRGTCNFYNRSGTCNKVYSCYFRHVCNRCGGSHPRVDCPAHPVRQPEREGGRNRDGDHGNAKAGSSHRK
ncbi:uncharacterized protein LOC144662898 [Oculina patagonica]